MAKIQKIQKIQKARKNTAADENHSPTDAIRSRRFVNYCLTLGLLGVVVLVWLSVTSFSPADPPSRLIYPPNNPVCNRVGIVGAYLAYGMRYWVGIGCYAGLVLMTLWVAVRLTGRTVKDLPWRLIGMGLLVIAGSAAVHLHDPGYSGEIVTSSSGVLGMSAGTFLLAKFGPTGSWVLLLISAAIGLMLTADNILKALFRRRKDMPRLFAELRAKRLAAAVAASGPTVASPNFPAERSKAPGLAATAPPEEKLTPAKSLKQIFSRPDRPSSPKKAAAITGAATPPKKLPKSSSELPSADLLAEPKSGYDEAAEIHAAQRKLVLQQTFDDFNVEAHVVGYQTGPVITLYEVSLSPGVKVAAVSNLATDIASSLAVPGVRIVPPRFGKDTVGIEVPNLDKEIVRIKELMLMDPEAEKKMCLPMYLGKDAGGDAIVIDLTECPHVLIAGTTGSGKSVCINTIIMSLLMTRTVKDVRFILVDPKMVEMAAFERLPHLLCPTVNDIKKAEEILEWATIKMDERYELLKEAGVKNIAGYNALSKEQLYERFGAVTEEDEARIMTNIPSYVIIIDELADLMMTSTKEVEAHVIRIAQKARAVGIHLVLATQRPSANVVTGLIKSNMPCRVSFRVASGQESRIVLDQKGAEVLLGQGDMLVLQPGTSTLVRAQGTYVGEKEVRAVVNELEETGKQVFDAELLKLQSRTSELSAERDELFDTAVDIVLASRRGSVSLLQRRMQIGYGRASRIIDQMGQAGILGVHKGSQARECMITLEEWEQMKESIAADQSGESSLSGEPTSV